MATTTERTAPSASTNIGRTPNTSIKVISLTRSHARRGAFTDMASRSGLEWSFFDAHETVDPALSYCQSDAIRAGGGILKPAELGCYSSHYTVWREFLASSYDQLLVLEDDIQADWRYVSFLIKHDFAGLGIDYLRLFAKRPCSFRNIATQFLDFHHDLIQFTGYAWGTQAYLMTRSGAERLVAHCRRIRRGIDTEMDRAWDHGVANLAIFPFPLFEVMGPSSISEDRYVARPALPLRVRLRRLPHQALERTRRIMGDRKNRPFRLKQPI